MGLINIRNLKLLEGADWSFLSDDISEWRFSWLLSDFPDSKWLIDNGSETPTPIPFDAHIPNSECNLADPKFLKVVNTIKKILCMSRSGHLALEQGESVVTRASSMRDQAVSLKTLALFLIKVYGEDNVAEHGFNLLTKADVEQFHLDIAIGRADKAIGFIDEVFTKLGTLSQEEIEDALLISSLKEDQRDGISITKFLENISIKKSKITDFTRKLIVNQLTELFPTLTLALTGKKRRNKHTEFPNACPSKDDSDDLCIGKTTFDSLTSAPKLLANYATYLPELTEYHCPEVKITEAFEGKYIKAKSRTPNIPSDIALYYLNAAISLVIQYGESIVDTKRDCEEQLMRIHQENPKYRRDYIFEDRCPEKVVIPNNDFTNYYNVTRYNELGSGATPHDRRNNVTVLQAYRMLVAASYILIHTFCIKRYSEVLELKESHLINEGLWGGSELHFGIRKADPTDKSNLVTGRPVPNVVADAVTLLAESNLHYYDEDESPFIFASKYTSNGCGEPPKNKKMSRDMLINLLCEFGDFIEVPTMMVNRVKSRFYITRTHVLRRFGAKAYYSLSNLEDFPALSWLMGHRSTEETWHYLLEEVGNEELTEERAFAVLDALYNKDINTSQVESAITAKTKKLFNNLSNESVQQFIQVRIADGATIHQYTTEDGEVILYMEGLDEKTGE
ncbi:hypothetical protein [Vibrio sp. TBV020]|uniref:hypothetical protein n=1 Tax=Vibrio sp. TBV020 TaxID=3137398 RepID=UPI0038CD54A3